MSAFAMPPFAVYAVLQVILAIFLPGVWRILALVPLAPMVWIAYLSETGRAAGSNLWPMPALFGSLIAIPYLGLVCLVYWLILRSRRTGSDPPPAT